MDINVEYGSLSVVISLAALVAYGAMSTDLYLSGLPGIMAEFSASHADVQMTLSLFMVGYASGQLIYGPFSDRFGRKPILYVGLVLYSLATIACLFSTSLEVLWVGRLAQGLTAASGPVVARAMVRDMYEAEDAARVMMYLAGAMATAPILAPVLGSWLLNWFDWHSHFALLLLFSLATLAAVHWQLKEPDIIREKRPVTLGSLVNQYARCLNNSTAAGYLFAGSLSFAGMFAFISSAPFLFVEMMGISEQQFGYCFMGVIAGYLIGSLCSARLVSRLGVRKMLSGGLLLEVAAALILILYVSMAANVTLLLILPFSLYFCGAGAVFPSAQIGYLNAFESAVGSASSIFGFIQVMTGALSGYIVGIAYDGTALPTALILLVSAVLALVAFKYLVRRKSYTSGDEAN